MSNRFYRHLKTPIRIVGILVMLFSFTMLLPLAVSFIFADGQHFIFITSFVISMAVGFLAWIINKKSSEELRRSDGFLVTTLSYTMIAVVGTAPFLLIDSLQLSWTDAFFESLSGLTSTGATVLTNLDDMPKSLLFYRQQLQWFGGMGIILLAVAVLPTLGAGGMMLYRAETPGPIKSNKLTPRITETAKSLWYIYLILTMTCACSYWLAGMSIFDAICHSFSTVSIGGFSTHDASIGYFNNSLIEVIAIVFMILCGINFGLHFIVWKTHTPKYYVFDSEVKFYLLVIISCFILCTTLLVRSNDFQISESIRKSLFQAVSIITTTGFLTDSFSTWPYPATLLLVFASFIGGCAGSTAGGIKSVRVLLMLLHSFKEIRLLIHPHAIFHIKLSGDNVNNSVMDAIWGFIALYIASFFIIQFFLLLQGLDPLTAFSATAAMINNLGPGLGEVAANYQSLSSPTKWTLCFAMLLGRLELYTILVVLSPTFWKR